LYSCFLVYLGILQFIEPQKNIKLIK
jgi:hypothetical protein